LSTLQIEPIAQHADARGELLKILPRACQGEIYLVKARPGASRGHHVHHNSGEWFAAISGRGILRAICPESQEVREVPLHGVRVYVPAGWAHAIFNTGETDLVVIALADAPYNPEDSHPHTVPAP